MTYEEAIDRISAKLSADGLAKNNYSRERADKILSGTVAPVFCKRVLELYEDRIKALLRETPRKD